MRRGVVPVAGPNVAAAGSTRPGCTVADTPLGEAFEHGRQFEPVGFGVEVAADEDGVVRAAAAARRVDERDQSCDLLGADLRTFCGVVQVRDVGVECAPVRQLQSRAPPHASRSRGGSLISCCATIGSRVRIALP